MVFIQNLGTIDEIFLGASNDSQLIIASQNFSNLDDPLIRRDSLRFVIKDKTGQSYVGKLALGDLHKNQNLRLQIENSDKWGVKPTISDIILEDAIREYKNNMIRFEDFYFSELF